jgi:hypothetical protein
MRFAIFYFNPILKGIKMSQTNLSIDFNDYTSIADMAYKQAVTGDTLRTMAKYALNTIVGFPEEISKTDKATLFSGYQLRFNENNPKVEYVVVDGNYVVFDGLDAKQKKLCDKLERAFIGVDFAMSFSQQAFGSLKDTEPAKHRVVKEWRDRFSSYASNKLKKLVTEAKQLQKEEKGETRERGATKAFDIRVSEALDDLKSKCKTAASRGDPTADNKALGIAIEAFLNAWTIK